MKDIDKTIKTRSTLEPLMAYEVGTIRVAVILDPRNHGKVLQEWSAVGEMDEKVIKSLCADGELPSIPVAVRVMVNRKPMYYRTGKAVTIPQFHAMRKASGNSKLAVTKADIKIVFDNVCKNISELVAEGRFNFDNLREKVTNRTKETFLEIWQSIISEKKAKTAKAYLDAYKVFVSFAGKRIDFVSLTPQLLNRWVKKMREDSMSDSTIGMYLRAIRIPINKCIAQGYISPANNPMKGIRIPKGKRRTYDSVDIHTINKLRNADVADFLKQSIDLWVFSYLNGGMNMADMVGLEYDDHYFRTDGKELKFIRKKTEDTTADALEILIPIHGEIKRIINQYGSKPIKGDKVFPMLLGYDYDGTEEMRLRRVEQANQKMRKHLHRVCEQLKLPVKVGPSFARHSFKTNAEHKGINNTYIEMAMGHALPGVQQNYMGSWRYEERIKYVDMLLQEEKPTLNLDGFSADQLKELQKLIAERLVKGA